MTCRAIFSKRNAVLAAAVHPGKRWKMAHESTTGPKRFYNRVGIAITLGFAVVAARMVQLQVLEHDIHREEMTRRLTGQRVDVARRGNILDRDGRFLATSVPIDSCALDPAMMRQAIGKLLKAKREPQNETQDSAPGGEGASGIPETEPAGEVREWMDRKLSRMAAILEMDDKATELLREKIHGKEMPGGNPSPNPIRFVWLRRGMSATQADSLNKAMSGAKVAAEEAWALRKKWQRLARASKSRGDRQGELRARAAAHGWRLVALEWESAFAGVHFPSDYARVYPQGRLAAHILGFTRPDGHGHEGMEKRYDTMLTGNSVARLVARDARRRGLSPLVTDHRSPEGMTVVLNIDSTIQSLLEEELERAVRSLEPESPAVNANAVVMEPYTGAVLALANYPSFDPNAPNAASARHRRNDAVVGVQEPGSIFKPLLIAAALEEGVAHLDEDWDCTTLFMDVGGGRRRKISDIHPYGRMPLRQALAKSSNPGMVRVAGRLGPETLRRYVHAFGFGERSGGDFPGESRGRVTGADSWSSYTMGSVPMGYEINVTTLQMACAYSVIANGGLLPRPRLLAEIRDAAGGRAFEYQPLMRRRVISEETAARMRQVLRTVVAEGTGRRADIPEFRLGGKTGTANMVLNEEEKRALGRTEGYSSTRHTANFVALAPYDAPRVVICVSIRDTRKFGGEVAAPTAAAIAKKILLYLNVPGGEKIDRQFVKIDE